MSERRIHEVSSDTEDVTYSIKRAKLSPASPSENVDSNKLYSNGYSNNANNNTHYNNNNNHHGSTDVSSDDMPTNNSMEGVNCTVETDCHSNNDDTPTAISDHCVTSNSDPFDQCQHSLPMVNPVAWVQKQIEKGVHPMSVLASIMPPNVVLPDGLSNITLWSIVIEILSDTPKRVKLPHINTLHDVTILLKSCTNIIVVSGAGISVSCGIPDFRSKDGIYARLAVDYPDLPSPQAMFDIQYFSINPKPFYKFAAEIWPGKYSPSPSHRFIKLMENRGSLLRHYTQNIDTLESVCGIKNVIECHGSFATATCRVCRHRVQCDEIRDDVMAQNIPICKNCPNPTPESIMKPDIVFFGEGLPSEFHAAIEQDRTRADLVIVMGSSLKVKPVAHIPNLVPADIPQILINREPLPHLNFDVELLGDCDVIVSELCSRLGWTLPEVGSGGSDGVYTTGSDSMDSCSDSLGQCVKPARYLFPGAEVCSTAEDASQVDSCSEVGNESPETHSGVTTEDEDIHTDNYVNQMRYAMGCTNPHSENPGPSGINRHQEHSLPPCSEGKIAEVPISRNVNKLLQDEKWDTESVGDISVAAQMGDSREPSIDSISVSSLEEMETYQTT